MSEEEIELTKLEEVIELPKEIEEKLFVDYPEENKKQQGLENMFFSLARFFVCSKCKTIGYYVRVEIPKTPGTERLITYTKHGIKIYFDGETEKIMCRNDNCKMQEYKLIGSEGFYEPRKLGDTSMKLRKLPN